MPFGGGCGVVVDVIWLAGVVGGGGGGGGVEGVFKKGNTHPQHTPHYDRPTCRNSLFLILTPPSLSMWLCVNVSVFLFTPGIRSYYSLDYIV